MATFLYLTLYASSIDGILSWCNPFKVVNTVIMFILVLVIHYWKVIGIGNKSGGNKSVYPDPTDFVFFA